jgi:hypothetical protein
MVEIFQQAEAINLRHVRVGFALGHAGRHLDGDLLEGECGFKRRQVGGQQPVDHRLLVLLDAPDARQRQL